VDNRGFGYSANARHLAEDLLGRSIRSCHFAGGEEGPAAEVKELIFLFVAGVEVVLEKDERVRHNGIEGNTKGIASSRDGPPSEATVIIGPANRTGGTADKCTH
jgi:hypothetical protein